MQKSNLVFPEEIYEKYLRVICEIKFTPREIDIIACLISGKTPQAIANFLSKINGSIELQTVNTHILNIRRKIDGNARGSIIEFIEKSDKHKIVHQYYLNLLIQKEFYESLNEAASFLKNEIESFTIVTYQQETSILKEEDNNHVSLVNHLQNYLKFLTNDVTVDNKHHYTPISALSSYISKKHYRIYLLEQSKLSTKEIDLKERSNPISQHQIKNILLLLLGSSDNANHNTTAIKDFNCIDVSSQENPYFLFLEILKTCLSGYKDRIEEILTKFKQRYDSITTSEITSSIETFKNKKSLYKKINSWIRLKLLPHFYIYILLIITILCFYSYMLDKYAESQLNNQNLKGSGYDSISTGLKHNQETNITSLWNAPYLPGYFVERSELKNKILEKFEQNKLNQVILVGLHGLSGTGKTYLALDLLNNPIKIYSFRGWITSNDEDKIKADYFKLGNELGLLTDDMKEEQKIAIVKRWLNSQENLLLVFDNVPNIEIIEKYLPLKGDIIVTSRNYKIPLPIEVDGMEEREALELLKNLISDSKCYGKCVALVKKLGYLPLAISQAGAYIEQNQMTTEKYLQIYEEEQNSLLSSDVLPVSDKHLPIYITWDLSLKEIKEKDKTGKAVDLLDLLSFCHFVDIPKSFLMEYLYGSTGYEAEIKFNDIISFLRQYSLLKITSNTLAIHHLVQDCIRASVTPEEQKKILTKTLNTVKKIYPIENKDAKDYVLAKMLIPHMESLLIHTREVLGQQYSVQLAIYISDAYRKLGDYNKAKVLLEEALLFQEKYYRTRKHIEIADTLSRLGLVLTWLGDYSRAINLLEEALSFQEKYYGTRKHIEIADTLSRLGIAYFFLGDYGKAKVALEEALVFQENHYGTHKRIEITSTQKRLGLVLVWLGDYSRAMNLLEEALSFQEKYYGTRKHIEIADTLSRLGIAYFFLGDYGKAKVALEEALVFQENYYGTRKHINPAFTIEHLGQVYLFMGDHSKAKELLKESLSFQENHYGTRKHIDIAFTVSSLGQVYLWLEEYNKAKALLEEAIFIQENHYGTRKHIEVAFTIQHLGQAYLNLKEYSKAKALLEEALALHEHYYGVNHPEVANALIALAQFEYVTSNNKNALTLLGRATHILQNYKELNPEHNYIKIAKDLKKEILEKQKISSR